MPIWNWGQPLNGIIQVAFIVEDIRAAMPIFAKQLNIGPWFLVDRFEIDNATHRGIPTDVDITLALGNSGHMMFELIQQNNDVPSVYREVQEKRGWGFHHWAVAAAPDAYDGALQGYLESGYTVGLEGYATVGGRMAYIDTTRDLPGMIELIEVTPSVEALFQHVHQANRNWDGVTDPIRRF